MDTFRKYAILCSTLILCGMLLTFLHNLSPLFERTETDYKEHRAVNLSMKTTKAELSDLLYKNGYVADEKDAAFIADTLVERLKRLEYPNLYHLQKRAYGKVPMLVVDSAGVLTKKVKDSNDLVGISDPYLPSIDTLSSTLDKKDGDGELAVIINSKESSNLGDVLIKVEEHYLQADSVKSGVIGYAKTDSNGIAQIKGLDRNKGYSVLPIKRGYEYGSAKGIAYGHFDKYKYFNKFWALEYNFEFEQVEHRIQMIDNYTLKQIKDDGALTVRTPKEYKTTVIRWFGMVLLGWWILCFVLIRQKKNFDPVMIAAAMFLTGLCVLIMFSIQNPLTEELRGVEMATGVLMGLACVIVLQYVDFIKLYQNKYKWEFDIIMQAFRWLFLPFKRKVAWLAPILAGSYGWWKKFGALMLLLLCLPFGLLNALNIDKLSDKADKFSKKVPKGFGWLMFAILLTLLLWTPLGQSIGGMKVNLRVAGLTFQPSEIAKYLILFFIAAFFVQNADTIINYSRPTQTRVISYLKSKIKTLSFVIVGLLVLMGIYAIIGDMGPGLVIGVTFVLIYSLVKSKVNLDNLNDINKWQRIFTCDFAMLIYGIVSFAIFVVIGGMIGDSLTGATLWFIGWIIYGVTRHKQFFETAFILNLLIFAFIFGGQVLQNIPGLKDTDTAERFEQRTRMCVNTWGDLNIENKADSAEAVSNTQVANGLWALSSGGMTGQGLGEGNPNLIPAFHTDMILSSIGEQIGWIGLLFVVLVFAVLLRRMLVVGYKVGHPFAFYFCSGVAIVSGVQFFIIALGSSGMIPLTGITVPFLSYGRVSVILNLIAFGIVLSLSQNIKKEKTEVVVEKVRQRSVGDYNYPISIATWTFVILAGFTLGVWQYYCLWNRGNTIVHPAFVYNKEGMPIIEYNPRIALLTKEMWAGNIYDRNGLLLATSNKDVLNEKEIKKLVDSCGLSKEKIISLTKAHVKRYYPFGEHLFFMLGNINTGLYFNSPIGYMAESRHLSYLRDYDNVLRDEEGNPVVVYLKNKTKEGNRFVKGIEHNDSIRYIVRDNSELIKYLKDGLHGAELEEHNEKVKSGNFDLHLTVDAKLQTMMQNSIAKYVEEGLNIRGERSNYRRQSLAQNNHLRISVVVLDAENGDLLTSANYPLPDFYRLREEDSKGTSYYNDNNKPDDKWSSYTDMDLGLTFPTEPGSTAKVMSAMAGLNKMGTITGSNTKFDIQLYEVIDYNREGKPVEPPMNGKTNEWVDMKQAIVVSSNCYFINLVNKFDLYKELEAIYSEVGIRLNYKETYNLLYSSKNDNILKPIVDMTRSNALSSWDVYQNEKSQGLFVNGKHKQKLRKGEWMWAWGQNLYATPLAMARVVSAVVNNGDMPESRYTMADDIKLHNLTSSGNAMAIKGFMKGQYEANSIHKNYLSKYGTLGGKTGTPHRSYTAFNHKNSKNINDGWYVFYVDNKSIDKSKHNIAVAVRMERIGLNGGSSTDAMWLSREVVIPMLQHNKYIIEGNRY